MIFFLLMFVLGVTSCQVAAADVDELKSALQAPQTAKAVLGIARQSLESEVLGVQADETKSPPEILTGSRAGAFVTLEIGGRLRGCWGSVWPTRRNLAEEIAAAARGAAGSDPRFNPIRPDELDKLHYTVSVVWQPQVVRDLADIRPARDGVLVRDGERSGVALPHEGRTISYLIEIARTKARIPDDAEYEILRFQTAKIVDPVASRVFKGGRS